MENAKAAPAELLAVDDVKDLEKLIDRLKTAPRMTNFLGDRSTVDTHLVIKIEDLQPIIAALQKLL